ncbi:MAG TPA: insulinase family protein [Holophaga sp.]|nr:insulinase family protein [Holophaga sp.]
MRFSFPSRVMVLLLWSLGLLLRAQGLLPEVQERKLKNGFRVLVVERPGTGMVHAGLFLGSGSAGTGGLPPAASELLARCLFKPPIEGDAQHGKDVEALLRQEEGAFEALRFERIKLARRPDAGTSEELQGLELLQRRAFERIQELEDKTSQVDPLAALGADRQDLRVEADLVAFGLDLPKASLGPCCGLLADRMRTLVLARFPLERERLLRELDDEDAWRDRKSFDILVGAALAGHPYARVYDLRKAGVETLTWSDLRTYARWAAAPERAVLVLVGDLKLPDISPLLDRTFGRLEPGPSGWGHLEDLPLELPEGTGARRLQVSVAGERRLFMGWRVPPATHPDHQALCVVAKMLGGGTTSRLVQRVGGERGLADSLSVRLDVPGGRDTSLLVIDARPAERHGLAELEQAMQADLVALQRGAFQEGEIRRAQRLVEMDQLALQEDAARLAQALGAAVCRSGDWQLAFRALQFKQDFTQQEIQRVVLKYLVPGRSTIVFLEPDPVLMPQDRIEAETAKLLTRILSAKLEGPGQVETVVRETLRQLRMLPVAEREQTLRLLESQVRP